MAEPKQDKLIQQLVRDAKDVPDLRVLIGLLGNSSKPKHIRLYTRLDLSEWLEIPESGVVHVTSTANNDNPLGRTVVWVKRDTNVQSTRTTSREAQADFMKGSVASAARGSMPLPGRNLGFQAIPYQIHSQAMSCVHEFCDFTILSYLGGGTVYCTEDAPCGGP
jgi:hypothetical protein